MGVLPGTLAVRVTACAVSTDATFAVNTVAVAFAGIVTVAGKVTAALLLNRLTLTGPLAEAELSFTLQVSVAAPVTPALVQ